MGKAGDAKHTLKVTNPDGHPVLTKVELDGETQYVSAFDITGRTDHLEARLVYPFASVVVELDEQAVTKSYSVKLFIPGYEGIQQRAYGESIPDALRNLAHLVEHG